MLAGASEIAISPNAQLTLDGSELPQSFENVKTQRAQQLPETIEDVDAGAETSFFNYIIIKYY